MKKVEITVTITVPVLKTGYCSTTCMGDPIHGECKYFGKLEFKRDRGWHVDYIRHPDCVKAEKDIKRELP